jgi:hypothetical protein
LTNAIDMKIERVLAGFLIGWTICFNPAFVRLRIFTPFCFGSSYVQYISFHSMWAIQRETERNSGLGSSWSYYRLWWLKYIISSNETVLCISYVLENCHCVQTNPAKNFWTRAYLIPERTCHLCSSIVSSIHFVPFNVSNSKRNWAKFGVGVKLIVILRHIIAYFSGFVNDVTAWWPGFVPKKNYEQTGTNAFIFSGTTFKLWLL